MAKAPNTFQIQLIPQNLWYNFFEAKYLPQIAPETVSEHEYVKNFLGGHAPRPGGQSLQNLAYGFQNLLILDQDFQISEEDFRDF